MPSTRTLLISIFATLATISSIRADSDGTFAFGEDYAVFTRYGPSGKQTLNVISLSESQPLEIVSNVDLPVSYSSIVIHGRFIFVRWWKTLYAYELKESWTLELLHTFYLPKPQLRPVEANSIFLHGNTLFLYNDTRHSMIDLSKPIAEWNLEHLVHSYDPKLSDWEINKAGDWVPYRSTCLESGEYSFCLVYGESNISHRAGGNMIFHDKVLLKRKRNSRRAESIIHIHTRVETVD